MINRHGFTLIEVLVVLLVLIVIAAIVVPSFVKARNTASGISCINNLRLIDGGKEQWAKAANQTNGDTVDTAACNAYIKGETTPHCPSGGIYRYNAIGEDPECSVGADSSHPFRDSHLFRG